VRDRARYVAPSVHEEGAAAIIEALVLAGKAWAAGARARDFAPPVTGPLPEPVAESR